MALAALRDAVQRKTWGAAPLEHDDEAKKLDTAREPTKSAGTEASFARMTLSASRRADDVAATSGTLLSSSCFQRSRGFKDGVSVVSTTRLSSPRRRAIH